ncbi:MAG: N-acetyltransferase family protein [Candidatus Eremiobacterota bacterium]
MIRPARKADLPALLALSNRAADTHVNFATDPERLEDWEQAWEAVHRTHPWLVAEDGAFQGFARASPHRTRGAYARTAELSVYVEEAFRGHGVGRALYGALIPMLKERGFAVLLAGIALPNPSSIRLHEFFGFQPVGTFRKVGWKLGRWVDVGYWQLVLHEGDGPPPD